MMLYRIVRASGAGRRAGQRHLTPLVGREEELAMLTRRWERARQGDGQLVLVVGEPGLGKSRLIEEFHTRLREVPHTWVEWSSSQLLQNTPLHPLAEWGRMRFGGPDVSVEQRLADLENTLAQIQFDPAENVPLLAPLLDIPPPPERRPELAPEEPRRQMAALTNWIIAAARAQPIVLAVEDAHWADPSTLDLLRGIAERGALAPLFVLITARPELRPAWGVRSHHGTISLVPLDRHQVRDMVSGLAAQHALAKEVVQVTERTGGVPLFVEELTRLLLERGEQDGVQTIPPTLQQSLTARLDRLGSAREVGQIGAVTGRDFSYPLIRSVAAIEDSLLRAALERLAEADILLVQGVPPDSSYRFKHALIQDAAYENLLKSRRQLLHRRVGETLRDRVVGTVPPEPELLAHHFIQAGLTETAIEWWGKAGHQSVARSALVEAIEQFTRALDLIATLPPTPALRREQIELQVALITPLIHVKGYAAPETKTAVEKARVLIGKAEALAEHPEDPLLLFSVPYGLWVAKYVAFDGDVLRQLAADFLDLAEKEGATVPLMIGHRLMGMSLLHTGDISQGRAHFDRGLALYSQTEHRLLASRFGQDIRVAILSCRSWTQWILGYPDLGLIDAGRALKDAREIGQAATLMYALNVTSLFHMICRNFESTCAEADELVLLADGKGAKLWKALGVLNQVCVLAVTGEASDAVAKLTSGISAFRATGSTIWMPWYQSHLARAYAEIGQFGDAWHQIDEAMSGMGKLRKSGARPN
jgi:AAA ATPase domain